MMSSMLPCVKCEKRFARGLELALHLEDAHDFTSLAAAQLSWAMEQAPRTDDDDG